MPASLQTVKLLSVRMPESKIRKLKMVAAHRGISMQEAVQQALESWLASSQKNSIDGLLSLRGSLSESPDVDTMRHREREAELAKR